MFLLEGRIVIEFKNIIERRNKYKLSIYFIEVNLLDWEKFEQEPNPFVKFLY